MVYVSHLLEDYEMKNIIAETGCGVESIEFSISENLDSLYESIRSYKKRLEKMGCTKLTFHGPFLDLNPVAYDRWVLEITRLRYEQAYTAAQMLGARKIVYHTCYTPQMYLLIGWADRVVDFYNRFLEGKHGIQILMENVQDPEIEPILEVAERIKHPDFGICLDVGHAHCYSRYSVTQWARSLGQFIKHLHLHDNDGTADSHNALGEGTVPLAEVLSCVRFHNPEVTCTIECSRERAVRKSMEWLKMGQSSALTVEG